LGSDVIEVHHVPTPFVHQQWASVEAHLRAALEHAHGDLTIDQLRADLGQNRASLYRAVEDGQVVGAAAVVFQNQRNARVAFVNAIGGHWIAEHGVFDQFTALLRQAGATRIAGAGRDSIVRLWSRFGLQKKYTVFEGTI
jgi:hypothetical protein